MDKEAARANKGAVTTGSSLRMGLGVLNYAGQLWLFTWSRARSCAGDYYETCSDLLIGSDFDLPGDAGVARITLTALATRMALLWSHASSCNCPHTIPSDSWHSLAEQKV